MRILIVLFLLLPFGLGLPCLPGMGVAGHTPDGPTLDLAPAQGGHPFQHNGALNALCGFICTTGVVEGPAPSAPALLLQRLIPAYSAMPEAETLPVTLPPRA